MTIKPITFTIEISDFSTLISLTQAVSGLTQAQLATRFSGGSTTGTIHPVTIHNWLTGAAARPHRLDEHIDTAIDILSETPGGTVRGIGDYGLATLETHHCPLY